jgi:hypothetical protein
MVSTLAVTPYFGTAQTDRQLQGPRRQAGEAREAVGDAALGIARDRR